METATIENDVILLLLLFYKASDIIALGQLLSEAKDNPLLH